MPEETAPILLQLAKEEYCYLTTTGRRTGNPHQIEIWFGAGDSYIYLMAGNHGSDWVLNLRKDPHVTVRIAKHGFQGMAYPVMDPQEQLSARHLLADKYEQWEEGRTLSEWAGTALVVRIDLVKQE
jgi:deazaflavin-dependent oxidoreductase (nitroreductase family)